MRQSNSEDSKEQIHQTKQDADVEEGIQVKLKNFFLK